MMCLEDQRSRILGQYARFNSYLKELFNGQPVEIGEPDGRQTYFYTLQTQRRLVSNTVQSQSATQSEYLHLVVQI